ncbi:MAG: oligoribonuclease [Candidatus Nomurabacteria bacterium]|jgi:oligoribonuclease|nr:oligoribonuclease [Candidatus Nomurabacteria bacterium]
MKANLLWVDLEMTGLDPAEDRIVELAAIGTDWDLKEVLRYTATAKVDENLAKRRMTGQFWTKNKRLKKTLLKNNLSGQPIDQIENDLVKIIAKNFSKQTPIYLAGNSIHQDRKFIEREMPLLNAKLHYRMLDISAWKIVFADKLGVEFKKPETHRALEDIEGSIEEFKFYLEKIGYESS